MVVFAFDLLLEVADLLVVQEVERRVELLHPDDPGGSLFLLSVCPDGLLQTLRLLRLHCRFFFFRCHRGPHRARTQVRVRIRPGYGFHVVQRELNDDIADQLKILCPQQSQEVVRCFRRERACLVNHIEEPNDLVILGAGRHCDPPHAVLVEYPRNAVGLVRLRQHYVVVPREVRFGYLQLELGAFLPDGLGRPTDVLDRTLVDRIVREVQLDGA